MKKLIRILLLSLSINTFASETISIPINELASRIKVKIFTIDRTIMVSDEEQINGFIKEIAANRDLICNISYIVGDNYRIRRVIITYR